MNRVVVLLLLAGIGVGSGCGTTKVKTLTATRTETETVTQTVTVTQVKRVRVKPAGPRGTIPGDGTFLVGVDIRPGTYRAASATSGNCYWERDRDLKDSLNSILGNDNTTGPVILEVLRTDYAVKTTGCETFRRIR